MHFALTLADQSLQALPSGALHWPDQNLLVVSDLHLGKSARLARRAGALLPPYEGRATLEKLDADIAATNPQMVICLGDSFDDLAASEELADHESLWLTRLMAGRKWIWIEGNHDPGPSALGGTHLAEVTIGPLTFRHIAERDQIHEISGHYHPKARLAGRSHPCFLADRNRLILPAYGTYTGGLWSDSRALTALMQPNALAILTGTKARGIPMPR